MVATVVGMQPILRNAPYNIELLAAQIRFIDYKAVRWKCRSIPDTNQIFWFSGNYLNLNFSLSGAT